jgi:hypothetical protein
MAKLSWDDFVDKHGKAGIVLFATWNYGKITGLLPSGKKRPTPMALLKKRVAQLVEHDWTFDQETAKRVRKSSPRRPRGTRAPKPPPLPVTGAVLVENADDFKKVLKAVGAMGYARLDGPFVLPCQAAFQTTYELSQYEHWLKTLG